MAGITENGGVKLCSVSDSRSSPYRSSSLTRVYCEFLWVSSLSWNPRIQSASITNLNLGAVAQLGERLICIQEVAGSIPTSSTSFVEHVEPRFLAPSARRVAPSKGL